MGFNKFVYFGNTKFDLSGDTVSPESLLEGFTAHDKSGTAIVGTASGGGMPSGFSAIARGTYNLSSAVQGGKTFGFNHNLGVVPDVFIFYAPSNIATTYSMVYAQRNNFYWRSSSYVGICGYHGNSTTSCSFANVTASYGIKTLTATSATITTYSTSTSYYWRAGTYNWIAIKFS